MIAIALFLASILGVWAAFSSLVFRYKRPATFTLAGVAVYVGILAAGALGRYLLRQTDFVVTWNSAVLDLGILVLAISATALFYYLLKKAWEKHPRDREDSALLDDIN